MNTESGPERPGPLLLLGKPQESLQFLVDSLLFDSRCRLVRSPGEAAVETMASMLKPAAVLLDASELYLGGRAVLLRLRERSAASRVIFVDVDGPWALLIEHESDETNDVRIQPCALRDLGAALMAVLETATPSPVGILPEEVHEPSGELQAANSLS